MEWGPLLNGMALGWQALPCLHLLAPRFRLPCPCFHHPWYTLPTAPAADTATAAPTVAIGGSCMHAHPALTADALGATDGGADAAAVVVAAQWLLLLLPPHICTPSRCCCCTYAPMA